MERGTLEGDTFLKSLVKSKTSGQVAVEYILMLVVVTSIIVSIFAYLKKHHLGSFEDCAKANAQNSFVCNIYGSLGLSSESDGKKFKYFQFKR